ncbi:hypothetical protein [Gracilimonas sp.]|uniref:TolB family protein n=1 Tax=Gracilimonas sp. TaxID=1974203 RepID=UPI0032EEF2BD
MINNIQVRSKWGIFFAILICSTSLYGQAEYEGVWELESERGKKIKLFLFHASGEIKGYFNSGDIGRTKLDSINISENTLSWVGYLSGNYRVYAEFKRHYETLTGNLNIQGHKEFFQGKRILNEIDDRPWHSEPKWSPVKLELLFASDQFGNRDIMLYKNGQIKNLSNHSANDEGAIWSQDGKRIAFISDRTGTPQIYIMNSDGSGLIKLTSEELNYSSLQWSNSGEKILFLSQKGIHLIDLDGLNKRKIINSKQSYSPRFSHDDRKIVFTDFVDKTYNIYLFEIETEEVLNISNSIFPDFNGQFSPQNSEELIWVSRRDGNPEVYKLNLKDDKLHRLTNNLNRDNNPRWSPNAKMIAWVSRIKSNAEIYYMKQDGSEATNLSKHISEDVSPSWSFDSSKIAFISDRNGVPNVNIVDLITKQVKGLE